MKFSIYGRFQLDIQRENDAWAVYRLSPGKSMKVGDVVLPPELPESELAAFLDDVFHELAGPGDSVERLA